MILTDGEVNYAFSNAMKNLKHSSGPASVPAGCSLSTHLNVAALQASDFSDISSHMLNAALVDALLRREPRETPVPHSSPLGPDGYEDGQVVVQEGKEER